MCTLHNQLKPANVGSARLKDIKQEVKEEVSKDADMEVKEESHEATRNELVAMKYPWGMRTYSNWKGWLHHED